MRLLGLSRKAFLAVLVGLLALGAGGMAIADGGNEGRPSADRVQATEFSATRQLERREKHCTDANEQPYVELKQRVGGEAVGDPRFAGDIVVNQRVLIRVGDPVIPGAPETIGQAFGTVLYLEKGTQRKKAFVTFLATLEFDPSGSPNPAALPIRAEGAFFGDVFAKRKVSNPLNHGRVISNFTSHVAADATRAQGQFGGTDAGGRDDTANTGVLMKGDCGGGFAKAYRKTFGHAHGEGHGDDGDRGKGRDKGRDDDDDRGRGRGKGRGRDK